MKSQLFHTYLLIALPLVPVIAAAICFAFRSQKAAEGISLAASVAVGALTVLAGVVVADQDSLFSSGGALRVDHLSFLMLAVISLLGLATAIYSIGYMRIERSNKGLSERKIRYYYIFLQTFIATMILVVVSNSLGIMWVALEATTLVSGLLVAFDRTREAVEAAWKYLILCTVGIALALFGTVLTYFAAVQVLGEGSLALDWSALMAVAGRLDPAILKIAFVFVMIGYGTKAGLAPLHNWLPDAHSQAPAPISALLSGILLGCALYAIIRFHLIVSAAAGPEFSSNFLIVFGLISIALAAVIILNQREYKRLLAYSSVEHMGLIAVGVGIGGKLALFGAALHFVTHAVSKSLLFFASGRIAQRYKAHDIEAVRGVLLRMPVTGTVLFIGALAIAGSPPFGPFVSEFAILAGAFKQGQPLIGAGVALLLVVVFAGVLSALGRMAFGEHEPPPEESPAIEPAASLIRIRPNRWMKPVLIAGVAAVIVIGPILPGPLSALVTNASLIMGGK